MPTLRSAAFAALFALPLFVSAQTFQEKVEVHYVEIPVTVLRESAPVRNLTKANFEIYDSGTRRTIESFDAIDFTAPETMKTVSPLNPASRRNFLLLFDLSFSSPVSVGRAQEAARNFVARSVGRRDLVGVAVIDVDRGFRFLTSFTTDRNLLAAAIKDPRNFRAFDPLQLAGNATTDGLRSFAGEATGRNERGDPGAEVIADLRRSMEQADDAYRRSRVQKQVETLGTVARSLQKLAGRKHVVLLSEGFDPRLVQGRSAGEMREQHEENQAVSLGEVWKVDSDKRFGNAGAQRSIQFMAEEFRRSDVVLHAVDIQGVRVQNDIRNGAKVNLNDGLFLLAGATGGEVFKNSNDINAEFDRLVKRNEVVYVLGFRAPAGKAGQFHELKVKLVGVPGGRVSHRGGYYTAGAESGVERSLSTAEIILNDIPENDLDMAALAAAVPTDKNEAQVPVILEISGPDLIAAARNNEATTDIFVYAFDDGGIVRDSIYERLRLDVRKAGEHLRASGVKFYGTLHLPPGKYAIKTLVRVTDSDRKSFRRIDVDVPAELDVALLQPMFFAEEGSWIMVKADSRTQSSDKTAAAPYPFVVDGESFIPAARATLRHGEPRLFTVWVWNAEPDELTWEIAPEARLVSNEPEKSGMTKFVFALDKVPAGASELGVTMRKKGSDDERRVSVPIRIR
jgi:VWFA-related protein